MKIMRPKSYWLSCMVVNFTEQNILDYGGISYAEILQQFFADICDQYTLYLDMKDAVPEISDPVLGNNVASSWERSDFETFMRRVGETKGWIDHALSDKVTEEEAFQLWQKVFGEEWFKEAAKSLTATYVAPITGKVKTDNSILSSQDIKIREHRFYGEE